MGPKRIVTENAVVQAIFVPESGNTWEGELLQRTATTMLNTDTLDGTKSEIGGMKEISWTTTDPTLNSFETVNGVLTVDGSAHQVWLFGDEFTRSG